MHVYENLVAHLSKIILISQQPLYGSNVYVPILLFDMLSIINFPFHKLFVLIDLFTCIFFTNKQLYCKIIKYKNLKL